MRNINVKHIVRVMKKYIFTFVGLFYASSLIYAMPRIASIHDPEYAISMADLSKWSCGISMENQERQLSYKHWSADAKIRKQFLYVGYEYLPWLTAYAVGGSAKINVARAFNSDDSGSEIGVGAQANLLTHDILEPSFFEDKISVNAGAQLTKSDTEIYGDTVDRNELSASLTVSLINDVEGNKIMYPNSIAIFAGPIYSDYIASDLEVSGDKLGMTMGLEIFLTPSMAINIRADKFDQSAYSAGFRLDF